MIQNNLRTPQLAGFARQLGCKKIIELIVNSTIMDKDEGALMIIPECFTCSYKNVMFRCHTSMHLSGQPSAVKKEQTSRTQDVLTFSCLIFSSIELQTQALSLLSYGIQKIPPSHFSYRCGYKHNNCGSWKNEAIFQRLRKVKLPEIQRKKLCQSAKDKKGVTQRKLAEKFNVSRP